MNSSVKKPLGLSLYVHVPFCRYACAYCDFYFTHSVEREGGTFVKALLSEAKQRQNFFSHLTNPLAETYRKDGLQTLYLGGGTPSLLKSKDLTELLEGLNSLFHLSTSAEVTLEVNPEDLSAENLAAWARAGVSRLSLGVQSFQPEHAKYLGRRLRYGSEMDWKTSFKEMRAAGFKNVSLDLIYGFPTLTEAAWEENLRIALELQPEHLSLYSLTIESGTALARAIEENRKPDIDEEGATGHFLMARQRLAEAGYTHYEISNFARPGCFSRHNQNYWSGGAYLGLGPSAHSFDGHATRSENPRDLAQYLATLTTDEPFATLKTTLTLKDRFNEMILTRLRSLAGLSVLEIEKTFSKEWYDGLMKRAETMIDEGLLEWSPDTPIDKCLILSEQGRIFADRVTRHLLA